MTDPPRRTLQSTYAGPDALFDKQGNCIAACIASIFDLDLDAVDAPMRAALNDSGLDHWFVGYAQYARDHLDAVPMYVTGDMAKARQWLARFPPHFGVGGVKSPRGDWDHAVVVDTDLTIVWDPHPGQNAYTLPLDDVVVFIPSETVRHWMETQPEWKGFDPTYESWYR